MMSVETPSITKTLRYRHLVIAVLIVLFALGLRYAVLSQRVAHDPSLYPVPGTDNYGYLQQAQEIFTGEFPRAEPFYFHPGPAYVFNGIYRLLGTQDLLPLLNVLVLIDALTCGLLILAGWVLMQRIWGGYLAGIVYAVYPVALFYATTTLIAPLAGFLLAAFLAFVLWQREQLTLWRTVLLGIVAGGIAIHRLNLAPIVGLYVLWLFVLPISWQKKIVHSAIYSLLIVAIIAPFTYHNFQTSGGDFIPVATTGSLEIYMGNNRDSAGRHSYTLAHQNLEIDYMAGLQRDFQVAPEHAWGLFAYKFALFWSGVEPGNNVTFDRAREATLILDNNPIRFHWLGIIGLFGLAALWRRDKQMALFLGVTVGWICFGYVLVFAFGRIRFPAVMPLVLLSSYGLVAIVEHIRKREWSVIKHYALPVLSIALLYVFVNWALDGPRLPFERTYASLPAGAVTTNAQFDNVTLVGWRTFPEVAGWSDVENGWIDAGQTYTVELFWQINEPTDIKYGFFLAFVVDDVRYDGIDYLLGAVSFPEQTTDEWRTGQIYGEIVSIRIDDDVPMGRSGEIRLGVNYRVEDDGMLVGVPLANGDAFLGLPPLAVYYDALENSADPTNTNEPIATFGDRIQLLNATISDTADAGETISM
ncbi:MAG: hypothetical protein AAF126_13290, partial [Chloroflexota bacterium]